MPGMWDEMRCGDVPYAGTCDVQQNPLFSFHLPRRVDKTGLSEEERCNWGGKGTYARCTYLLTEASKEKEERLM